jgi:hypothetical protein
MTRKIEDEHPELFHYTGIDGLRGILKSQELWATHARFLNDGAELIEFRKHLPHILRPGVSRAVSEVYRSSPAKREFIERFGGLEATVDEVIRASVGGLYQTTFGTDGEASFAEAYVLSFCTPSAKRQAEHGLLSQWRCYGKDGGYALVFDSAALSKVIAIEAARWPNLLLLGGDVLYSDTTAEAIQAEFGESLDTICNGLSAFITSGDQRKLDPLYVQLLVVSSRYKHWGFSEEREVRIVAVPPNALIVAEMKRRREVVTEILVHYRSGIPKPIPTIHLFDDYRASGRHLPITRVIVGPGGDRDARRREVERLLVDCRLGIPVTVSEIPYIGG